MKYLFKQMGERETSCNTRSILNKNEREYKILRNIYPTSSKPQQNVAINPNGYQIQYNYNYNITSLKEQEKCTHNTSTIQQNCVQLPTQKQIHSSQTNNCKQMTLSSIPVMRIEAKTIISNKKRIYIREDKYTHIKLYMNIVIHFSRLDCTLFILLHQS